MRRGASLRTSPSCQPCSVKKTEASASVGAPHPGRLPFVNSMRAHEASASVLLAPIPIIGRGSVAIAVIGVRSQRAIAVIAIPIAWPRAWDARASILAAVAANLFNDVCERDSVYACHHRFGCRDDSTYEDSCDHESSEQCSHIASRL